MVVRRSGKKKYIVGFLLVLLAGGGFALSRGGGEGGDGAAGGGGPGEFPTAVQVAPIVSETWQPTVRAVGTLVAEEGVILRPEIAGRVMAILFEGGQKVDKGAPLFQLDDSIYVAQVAQAEAQLALAQRNLSRSQQLVGKGAGTEQSRDENSSQQKVAAANLALAKANLEKTLIVAPFSGTVGIRQVSVGDYVQPGQHLVSLQSLDNLRVDFRLPENVLGQLAVGQTLRLTTGAFLGEEFPGSVQAVEPLVDSSTRSVGVRAVVPNPEGKLRPGQFAEVELRLSARPDTLFVPAVSIVPLSGKEYVYAVGEAKPSELRATLTPVTILERQSERVAIAGEVKAGQSVLVEGQGKIMMMQGPMAPPALIQVLNNEDK